MTSCGIPSPPNHYHPFLWQMQYDVLSVAAKMLYTCEIATVLFMSVLGGEACSTYCLGGQCSLTLLHSWMHGREQAGRGSCEETGEAAHQDADDWLCGHHGQKGDCPALTFLQIPL